MDIEQISITNLNGGRVAQHFNDKLMEIVEDVLNVNKPAKSKRRIVLEVDVLPSRSRRECKIVYSVTVKLANMEKEESYISVGRVKGRAVASNQHIEQQSLPIDIDIEPAN